MTGFRNRLLASLLLSTLFVAPGAAQDGSGIPRDPSQPTAPTRKAPDRGGSMAVPLPPAGTIGNPAQPSSSDDFLPSAEPDTTQYGAFSDPSDGAPDASQPRVLNTIKDTLPNDLPVGQVADTPTRQQLLTESHDMKPGEVEVTDLGKVDPSEQGTLAKSEGDLGKELWSDSSYAVVADLMERMPVATSSPAMNDLVRRILLTGAKPRDAAKDGPTLFDIRTQRLADAGLVRDLAALFVKAGDKTGDAAARIDALLLNGEDEKACATVAEAKSEGGAALVLKAYCQIVAGDNAAAALSADLARVKGVEDAAFFALVAHITDGAPLPADLKGLTPVTLALARRAEALEPGMLADASPSVMAALALDKSTPSALRVTAAERAAARGAIDPAAALAVLRGAKAAKGDAATEGARLLQSVYATDSQAARAKQLGATMAAAEGRGLGALYAQLLARAAWEITPAPGLGGSADTITRILFLSSRSDRGADWLNALGTAQAGQTVVDELTVRLAIGAPTADRVSAAGQALSRLAQLTSDAALARRVVLYAGTLQAMGKTLPPEVAQLAATSPLLAAPAGGDGEIGRLADAAQEHRTGETVVLVLLAIGENGPGAASPAVLMKAVAALSKVGLAKEAAALALEAALIAPPSGGG